MEINIINKTSDKKISNLKKLIKNISYKVLNKKIDEINLIFVDDRKIKQINKKFLKKDSATDVIAFNYKNTFPLKIADIFISSQRAIKNSKIYNINYETEILILLCHGLLHILGYNDNNKKNLKRMSSKTLRILRTILIK